MYIILSGCGKVCNKQLVLLENLLHVNGGFSGIVIMFAVGQFSAI
jgi:hypothetical protein